MGKQIGEHHVTMSETSDRAIFPATPPASAPTDPLATTPGLSDDLAKRKVGALWLKTSSGGNKYLAGRVTFGSVDVGVLVLRNPSKTQDKHPDYQIFLMREEMGKEMPL